MTKSWSPEKTPSLYLTFREALLPVAREYDQRPRARLVFRPMCVPRSAALLRLESTAKEITMSDRRRYCADAMMADLTNHHHHLRAASEEEVERRMRVRYPEAVAHLVRLEESCQQLRAAPRPTR